MMTQDIFFTTKVASGKTFCNLIQERERLLNNISKGQHTVVVAPRRYGKTSLVCYVLEESEVLYGKIDLFCAVYEKDICDKISRAVSKVVNRILPFSQKAIKLIEQYFKNTSIGIKAGQFELKIEAARASFDPSQQIQDLLEGLEGLAEKNNQKIVLFFDEFQDLLKADDSLKLQAAIRAVAQVSRHVVYIFSGSSRVMLKKIFENRNQPLYMLCNKIILERISVEALSQHIQAAAEARWRKSLNTEQITEILALTETHPYYTNMLCDKVFDHKKLPVIADINRCWDECLLEQYDKIIADLFPLNTNRLKVLTQMALFGPIAEPNSKAFLDCTGLALGSLQKAIDYLMDYDYLYKSTEGYTLVDPLMKKFIILKTAVDS
ncbi:MAG: ATP-binding protein [Legionellales bacterium]|nr:ATP-binding protein [Legionellales bacterium]